MEKSFQLDQKETVLLSQLDQERTQALAMVGALSLDMEQAKKNLEAASERQKSFVRQALIARGVERYENARVQNGALIITLPDQMLPTAIQPGSVEHPNGSDLRIVKE